MQNTTFIIVIGLIILILGRKWLTFLIRALLIIFILIAIFLFLSNHTNEISILVESLYSKINELL